MLSAISGTKWDDQNGNDFRDTDLFVGDHAVFIIDVSVSTLDPFAGDAVGDVNNDGHANTILDGQLAGYLALNEYLVERGLGDTANVSVIVFAATATRLDMNPVQDGVQNFTTPTGDADNNSQRDIEELLKSITAGHMGVGNSTNFEAALQEAINVLPAVAVPTSNIFFLSDGNQNSGGDYSDEANRLQFAGANLRAFGVGENASLNDLRVIDPRATIITTTNELLDIFRGNTGSLNGGGPVRFTEPVLPNWRIYLDLDDDGVLDPGEPSRLTDHSGRYTFNNLDDGTYVVREVMQFGWIQTCPGPQNDFSWTVEIVNGQPVDEVNFGNQRVPASTIYISDNEGILGTVELITREVEVIGDMGVVLEDIAISRTGEFYGVSDLRLYRINPANAALTEIGLLGVTGITALEFGPDDELYAAGDENTQLYTIDTETGVAAAIGSINQSLMGDLAYADGQFYGSTLGNDLLSINLAPLRGIGLGRISTTDVHAMDADVIGLVAVAGTDIVDVHKISGIGTFIFDYSGEGLGPARGASFGHPVAVQPPVLRGTIRGVVWDDSDEDGRRDPDENPFVGVEVYLDLNNNGRRDAGEPTRFTDADGRYEFTGLVEGDYVVRQTLNTGDRQTYPVALTGTGYFNAALGQTQLLEIDPISGDVNRIGAGPTGARIHGLALTSEGQYIGSNFETDAIYNVNPATGRERLVGLTGQNLSGAMSYVAATDTVYVIGREQGSSVSRLMEVDIRSGALTPIGPGIEGLQNLSSMAFDWTNDVFIAFDNFDDEFYEFDLLGNAVKLSDASTSLHSWSLAFNGSEFLMGNVNDRSQIVKVDPYTGAIQQAFRLSESVALESLEYVTGANVAHRITIVDDSVFDDVDFGRVGPVRELVVSESGDTVVTEAGSTDSFVVRLASEPQSDVVVDITANDTTEVEILTASVTLNAANWNTGETVTVRGVDDMDVDGDVLSVISITVNNALSDDAFDGAVAQVQAKTLDDDVPVSNTHIQGRIFRDDNRNGIQDNDEPPLTGAQVYLDENDNARRDPGELFVPSGESGIYQFSNIDPGVYTVRQILSGPTFQSSPRLYVGLMQTGQGNQTALYRMNPAGSVVVVGTTSVPLATAIMTRNSRGFGIGQDSNSLYEINPNTAAATLIGSPASTVIESLTYDSATDTIYAIGRDGAAATDRRLYVVDRRNGETTAVGPGFGGISSVSGVAFDSSTRRIILFDDSADAFSGFDLQGNGTHLSDAAVPLNSQSLAFDGQQFIMQLRNPSDQLQLVSVNPDTGQWQNAFRSTTAIPTASLEFVPFGDFGQRLFVGLGQTRGDIDFGQFNIAAGISVSETDGLTRVSESGITDTLNVILDRRPDFPVVVDVFVDEPSELEISEATRKLTFTPEDWNIPHQIVVQAVDDDDQDGTQAGLVTLRIDRTLSDDAFDNIPDQTVDVVVLDNDTPGITLVNSAVVVSESGSTGQVGLFLNSQPTSNVTIDVSVGDPTEVSVPGQVLAFSTSNWFVPQFFTVAGVDDITVDGNQTSTLTLSVRDNASDDDYDPLPDLTVNVTTLDDDTIGVYVDKTHLTVSESVGSEVFDVVLTAAPLTNVVLNVSCDNPEEVNVGVSALLFTPQNWFIPQTVSVTGRSDDYLDGDQQATITISVDPHRSDDAYDNADARSVVVTNVDSNVAVLRADRGEIYVSENGVSQTFSVWLTAAPVSDVVFDVASSDLTEAVVSPAKLTFTPSNWHVGQTITVTGVDDQPIDGNQVLNVSVIVDPAGSDDAFDNVPPAFVTVFNRDNDYAGFTLSKTAATVGEDGMRDTVHVVLNTFPSSNVVLDVGRQTHGEVIEKPFRLTFTPDNWDFPQVITLTGVDDAINDGDQVTDVRVAVNAQLTDNAWDELPLQTIMVTTVDDDQADAVPTVTGPGNVAAPGQPVTITWDSVPAAVSYELWLEHLGGNQNPIVNPTVTTDRFTIDAGLDLGRYRAWVRANLGSNRRTSWATGEFNVDAAPELHAIPFHGQNRRPDISWNPVRGATAYRLYVSNITLGTAGVVDTVVGETSFTPNFNFDFGVHRIWVRAIGTGNYSGVWSSAASYYLGPELLTPTLSQFDDRPDFTWTTLPGIQSYHLYVQKGSTVIVNEAGLTDTTYSLGGPLAGGDYRWWVRAFAGNGRGGAWSELGEFNIGGRPRIDGPVGVVDSGIATVTWGEVIGAGTYEIYLFNDDGRGLIHREDDLTETSFTTFPIADGNYRVWIKSYKLDGAPGQWSRAYSFVVDAVSTSLNISLLSPISPTFDDTPLFQWTMGAATSFDFFLTNGSTVIHHTDLTTNEWQTPIPLPAGEWNWWVRGKNAAGTGAWSAAARTDTSGRVVVLAPSGSTSNRQPTLVWTSVEGAGSYVLQLDNLTTGQNSVIREAGIPENSFTLGSPLAPGDYRAWVRAINGNTNAAAPWSFKHEFTVAAISGTPDNIESPGNGIPTQLALSQKNESEEDRASSMAHKGDDAFHTPQTAVPGDHSVAEDSFEPDRAIRYLLVRLADGYFRPALLTARIRSGDFSDSALRMISAGEPEMIDIVISEMTAEFWN